MTITPEWSHKADTNKIGTTASKYAIKASEQERKDVARRLKVDKIEKLEARFTVKREAGSMLIVVEGAVSADVAQTCIVSGAPIRSSVDETFSAYYSDNDRAVSFAKAKQERMGKRVDAELQILDEREDPEPAIDGQIDLGELAVQYLSLAVDPYPRAEGVIAPISEEPSEPSVRRNPFAELKNWKAKRDGKE
jgi:hypothetical protein